MRALIRLAYPAGHYSRSEPHTPPPHMYVPPPLAFIPHAHGHIAPNYIQTQIMTDTRTLALNRPQPHQPEHSAAAPRDHPYLAHHNHTAQDAAPNHTPPPPPPARAPNLDHDQELVAAHLINHSYGPPDLDEEPQPDLEEQAAGEHDPVADREDELDAQVQEYESTHDFSEVKNYSLRVPPGADAFVRKTIKRGFTTFVDTTQQGPQSASYTYTPPPGEEVAYHDMVQAMVDATILQTPWVRRSRCIINKHRTRHKSAPGEPIVLRMIFTGLRSNRCFRPPPPFTMHGIKQIVEETARRRFTVAGEEDLRHAFYQMLLNKAFRHYLCIETTTHGLLQFTRPPMGFSWASFALHKLLGATLAAIPPHVVACPRPYADNVGAFGHDTAQTNRDLADIRATLHAYGWITNDAKSKPAFEAGEMLGVWFDFTQHTTEPLSKTLHEIDADIEAFYLDPTLPRLRRIAGLDIWAAQATPFYLTFTHFMVLAITAALAGGYVTIPRDPDLYAELHRLQHYLRTARPTSMARGNNTAAYQHVFYTDASDDYMAITQIRPEHTRYHASLIFGRPGARPKITYQEYQNEVLHTLVTDDIPAEATIIVEKEAHILTRGLDMADKENRADALFAVDNQPLFFAVIKGRSNNPKMHEAATVFARMRQRNLRPTVAWVPSDDNPADLPTRPNLLPAHITHPCTGPRNNPARWTKLFR